MANIVVKNGYNGFRRSYNSSMLSSNSERRPNNQLPPIHGKDKVSLGLGCVRSESPFLQPSFSDNDDIVFLFNHDVKRIRQLSVHIGIKQQFEMEQYHCRFSHGRRRSGLPSKVDRSKFWRQSQKWIKRTENTEFDIERSVPVSKKSGFSSLNLNNLPRERRKRLEPVNIPELGCSYRLPASRKVKMKMEGTEL